MKKLMNRFKKSNKGFTMVELIVVIAIIAVLAVVIAPQYIRFVEKAKVSNDIATATAIETAITTSAPGLKVQSGTEVITWGTDGSITSEDASSVLLPEIKKTITESKRSSSNTQVVKWTVDYAKSTVKETSEPSYDSDEWKGETK